VGKSAGVFNAEKLKWLNAHYLKERPPLQLVREAEPFLVQKNYASPGDENWFAKAIATLQPRAETIVELVDKAHIYLSDDIAIDPKAGSKFLSPATLPTLGKLRARLAETPWNEHELEKVFATLMEEEQVKLGQIAQPVRVALTGGTASPGIFEMMAVLGKERTLARLDRVLTGA